MMMEILGIFIGAVTDFFAPDDIDEEQELKYENIAKDTRTIWIYNYQASKKFSL